MLVQSMEPQKAWGLSEKVFEYVCALVVAGAGAKPVIFQTVYSPAESVQKRR